MATPSGGQPAEARDRSRALDDVLAELVALGAELQVGLPAHSGLAHALHEVERLVEEPLRVAVLGRPGAGTVELVEALLGRRVVGAGWPLRSRGPIWFRFDDDEHVLVTHEDGRRAELRPLPGPDDAWPTAAGSPVSSLDIRLRAPALRGLDLVAHDDIPDDVVSAAVLVDQEPFEQHSLDLLARLHDRSRGLEHTAFAAMAVLRADRLGANEALEKVRDPTAPARVVVSLVLPVNLAMAHTARTGTLDDAALQALQELLLADDLERRLHLGRIDRRLAALLTGEGVRRCLPHLRRPGCGRADVEAAALVESGFGALEDAIRERWLAHAAALKIASVLGLLARAGVVAADDGHAGVRVAGDRLRAALAVVAADALERLDEVQVIHLLRSGALDLDAADTSDALGLLLGTRPRTPSGADIDTPEAVDALVLRWRALAEYGVGGRTRRWAASVVLQAAEKLHEHLAVAPPAARRAT